MRPRSNGRKLYCTELSAAPGLQEIGQGIVHLTAPGPLEMLTLQEQSKEEAAIVLNVMLKEDRPLASHSTGVGPNGCVW